MAIPNRNPHPTIANATEKISSIGQHFQNHNNKFSGDFATINDETDEHQNLAGVQLPSQKLLIIMCSSNKVQIIFPMHHIPFPSGFITSLTIKYDSNTSAIST